MSTSVQNNPELFQDLQGWIAPVKDTETYVALLGQVSILGKFIRYCTGLRTVVHAGGNIGVFPRVLSDIFQTVYTVEPDELNFLALQQNVSSCSNVHAYCAAFGYEHGKGQIRNPEGEANAYMVESGNDFEIMQVDDFQIEDCDLLILDVEGFEYFAVQGAKNTILRSSPVVCLEMLQPLMNNFSVSVDELYELMRSMGYVQRQVIQRRDHIFTRERF